MEFSNELKSEYKKQFGLDQQAYMKKKYWKSFVLKQDAVMAFFREFFDFDLEVAPIPVIEATDFDSLFDVVADDMAVLVADEKFHLFHLE